MEVSLDETIFGYKCHWVKPFLDESVVDKFLYNLVENAPNQ